MFGTMKKMPVFGEPRLDADLASIIAASEAAGKPGRAITSLYQKRVVIVALLLAVAAIGLAQFLSRPLRSEAEVAAETAAMPPRLGVPDPGASTLAALDEPLMAEDRAPMAAARPRQTAPRAAPRPSAKTVWYDGQTSADAAFGKASAAPASSAARPKAHTVFFTDEGSPQAKTEKGPATLAFGTE